MTATGTVLDHATADHLAAAAIDGFLSPDEETVLDAHLRACPACRARSAGFQADARTLRQLDLGDGPATTRARVAVQAGKALGRRTSMGRGTALLAAAVLVLAAVGASVIGGVGGRGGTPGESAGPSSPAIAFQTDVVRLAADELWIEANGLRFDGGNRVGVVSDPNTINRTLELAWRESGVDMRLNLYFRSNGATWWVRKVSTRDGRVPAEDVVLEGRFFEARSGEVWSGDVEMELANPRTGATATVHVRGLRLWTEPFVTSIANEDAPVPVPGGGPFDPGGELSCSGILQLSPAEAEQELLRRGFADIRWRLNQSPVIELESLKGIEDPVIVFPGATMFQDGSIALWVLPAADPRAEPMPIPSECPSQVSPGP